MPPSNGTRTKVCRNLPMIRLPRERSSPFFGAAVLLTLIFSLHPVCRAQQTPQPTHEQDTETLVEKVNDPTSNLTQIQIKDIFTPAEYGTNAQLNTVQIRPLFEIQPFSVIPFAQVVRPTLKIVTVPNGKGASTSTAYDDMQLLDLLVIPWPNAKETRFRWGIGPYLILPTASSNLTGQRAWQLGPAAGFSYRGIEGLKLSHRARLVRKIQ